jgi:hypothetical protein
MVTRKTKRRGVPAAVEEETDKKLTATLVN